MKRIYKRVLALALALFMVISLMPGTGLTVQAAGNDGTAKFTVGSTTYDSLQDAITAATNGSTKKIVLASDGTITGDYTIPQGVTLLIPFDDAATCYYSTPGHTDNVYYTPSVYRTLTMTTGSSITVEGHLSVSAKHVAAVGSKTTGASVSGAHGLIKMEEGSSITVKSTGNLYAWGYITGAGTITAKSGANVYEPIQIAEFRGGNVLSKWADTFPHKVFPFSQYYVQNIEVPLTLEYGAAENVYASAFMASRTFSTGASFINSDDGMFYVGEGTTITKYYDPKTDRLYLQADGDIELNGMTISIGAAEMEVSVNSKDFVLPINSNISITINSGSATLNQDVALLPGAEVIIGKNAALNISENCNLYVYDRDQWIGKRFVFVDRDLVPISYSPSDEHARTAADLTDAVLDVNGTVNSYGYIYTTYEGNSQVGGASIKSSNGTGKIHFLNGAGTNVITYQVVQVSDDSHQAVGVKPAMLLNSDGSYALTEGVGANTTYAWNSTAKGWVKDGQCAVTFDSDGGSKVATAIVDKNGTLAEPTAPTKEGYTFAGWVDADGNKVTFPLTVKDNTALKATWTVNTYTITFVDGDTVLKTVKAEYGAPVVAPTPTKEGYDFAGWDTEVPSTMPAKDMTVKATWTVKTYTLSFDTAGGSAIKDITQAYNTDVTAPVNPTKEGYTFNGWLVNGEKTTIPSKMPAENITYTADWQINSYTIKFNTAGAGNIDSIKGDYGTPITAPADPVKTGYTFLYWVDAYGNKVDIPSTMPAKNLELTAKWQINQYKIVFMDADKETVLITITQDYGSTVKAPTKPVKEGYTFTGWTDADNNAVTFPVNMPAYDTELFATWTINEYTISFNLDGGVGPTAITANYGTSIGEVSDPTKEGYEFKGWADETGAIVEVPTTMPAKNMELTAVWGIKTYEMLFVDTDGTELAKIEAAYGTNITAPTAPTKEGYTFISWVDANNNTAQIPDKMPAEDVTYTASWQVKHYSITFNTWNGIISSTTVAYGSPITVPEVPVREGYTFAGWDKEVPATMPAQTLVITATWTENTVTIVWLDEDGSLLEKDENVPFSAAHTYNGDTPTKEVAEGELGYYVHNGWTLSSEKYDGADYVYVAKYLKVEPKQFYIVFMDGDTEIESLVYSEGATVPAPADPEKEGYIFTGWVDGDGNPVTFPMTMPGYSLYGEDAIRATWEVAEYTITYMDGDSVIAEETVAYGDEIPEAVVPEKEGYTFIDWDREIPETMPAENLIIGSIWSVNQYTIEFDTKGGSSIVPITLDYGTKITVPADPTKTGHKFIGWNPSIPETMPAEDLVIEAKWEILTYNIYYYEDESTMYSYDSYEYGEPVNAPIDPTKEGYTFAGWNITIPETMPDKDVIAVAKWTPNEYTAEFDVDGTVHTEKALYGDAFVTPADPVKTGYTFAGWVDTDGNKVAIPETMPLGGIKVYASWTVNTYKLTFDSNGSSTVEAATYDYNSSVAAPAAPTREGYTFVGWVDEDSNPVTFPLTMPAKDMTVYARWQINEYTISFNTDGGSEVPAITTEYGAPVAKPANPGKAGYTFAGWVDEEGNAAQIPETMPAHNTVYKATWAVNQYTITFDSVGGSAVNNITQDYNTSVAKPADPTKEGYTFAGWVDADNNAVAFPVNMPVNGMDLKATWKINQYSVTFDTDGGNTIASVTVNYGETVSEPEKPEKAYHSFLGWVDEAGNPVTFPLTVGAKDVTLKAQWQIYTYTISWDVDEDGIADDSTMVAHGTVPTHADGAKPETAEYKYEFIKWDPEIVAATEATIYTARYKQINKEYTVTYDMDGGTAVPAKVYKYDDPVYEPTNVSKEGYTLAGWQDTEGNAVTFPMKMPAKNITVKAVWSLNEYQISWDTDGDGYVDGENDDMTMVKHGQMPTHADGKKAATAEYSYQFTGWSPAITVATKAAKYTAQFKSIPNEYTIKFVDTDGKVLASEKVAYGAAVTEPKDPSKTGYTFTGWDAKIPETMPANDVTITARWEAIQYEIFWDALEGDGKIDDSTYVAYGQTPVPTITPEKKATDKYTYTFIGWDANKDGKVDGLKPVTGDATYTAVFKAVEIPVEDEVERIWGKSRYKTSLAIADELKAELGIAKFNTVIIANGDNFPDALAGSYLASKKNAPILMTNPYETAAKVASDPASTNAIVQKYIEKNLVAKGKVYILGGSAAVPQYVEDNLKKAGYSVERLSGKGRYDTNLAILNEAGVSNEALLVCTGTNFADSLSASATGLPILLVNPDSQKLTDAQIKFLNEKKRDIYIIGGTGAVSDTYLSALKKYDSNGTIIRVKGKSRYETSVEVAKEFCKNPEVAVIASAQKFPDGLCGGPLAYFMDAPLVLTHPTLDSSKDVEKVTVAKDYIAKMKIKSGKALGGTGALADAVVRSVFGMSAKDEILGERYE